MYREYKRSKTSVSDTLELFRSIDSVVKKHLPEDAYLNRNCNEMSGFSADVESLLGREMGNNFTGDSSTLDEDRDNLTSGINSNIEAKIRFKKFDPVKGESAEAIKDVFEATPIDINAGYSKQSIQTNTRLRALDTPENIEHLEVLNMTLHIEQFKTVQDEFDRISSLKDEHESLKLRGTVREQELKIIKRIGWVLPYLESQAVANPNKFGIPASEVLEAIGRIMSVANGRQTRKENVGS